MISTNNQGGIQNDLISFLEGNLPSVGMTQQEEEDVIFSKYKLHGSDGTRGEKEGVGG